MYLYQAPENGSNTILRGADKDCVPKYPPILLVCCPPFSLTLTMYIFHVGFGVVFFFLLLFSASVLPRKKNVQSFPFTLFL